MFAMAAPSPRLRRTAGALLVAAGVGVALLALAALLHPQAEHGVALSLAGLAVPISWTGRRLWRRPVTPRGSITVAAGEVIVDAPDALPDPLRLGRHDLHAVVFDERPVPPVSIWPASRFPVELENGVTTALVENDESRLPVLTHGSTPPNVALIFGTPRRIATHPHSTGAPGRRPIGELPEPGVALSVADPAGLATWLQPLGLVRPADETLLRFIDGTDTTRSLTPDQAAAQLADARRLVRQALLSLAALITVTALALAAAFGLLP